MTLLVRQLASPSEWVGAGKKLPELAAAPPIWAIREFVPSEKDKGGLSVFEVAGEEEARLVAGAFLLMRPKIDKGPDLLMVAAPAADIAGAGIEIATTKGELHHMFADQRHRDLKIPDYATIINVAALFLKGSVMTFGVKESAEAARKAMRENQVGCAAIAKLGFDGNWRAKHVLSFIADNVAEVVGKAA